jgi:hypothetical protein
MSDIERRVRFLESRTWYLSRRADQQSLRTEKADGIIRNARTGPIQEAGPAIPVVDCGGSCAFPYDDLTGTVYYSSLLQYVGISYYNAYDLNLAVGPTVTATLRDKAVELFFRGRRVGIYRPYWFTDLIPQGPSVTLNGYTDPIFGLITRTTAGPITRWIVSCGTAVGPASRPTAINVLSLTQTNDPNANDVAIIADFPQFTSAWTGGLEQTALPRLPVYPTSDQRFSDVASWSSWTNTADTFEFNCTNKRLVGRYAWTANSYVAIGTQTTGTGTSIYFEQP